MPWCIPGKSKIVASNCFGVAQLLPHLFYHAHTHRIIAVFRPGKFVFYQLSNDIFTKLIFEYFID